MQSQSNPHTIVGNEEVFEINDFTVVTEFEVFVLAIENAIQELKAEEENLEESTHFKIKAIAERVIEYENYIFQLDYCKQVGNDFKIGLNDQNCTPENANDEQTYLCKAAANLMESKNDFNEQSVISRQFGIASDFILVYPIGKNNYFTETKVNMVMSAINVATLNIDCTIPVFFQFTRGATVGVLQNRNCLTNFEGVVLNRCLNKHRYLDGVIEMFKQKINVPVGHPKKISLQLDYQKEFNAERSLDLNLSENALVPSSCVHKYPFQLADSALIKQLWLCAIWTDLPENLLNENEHFNNVDPQNAHKWKFMVDFDEEYSFELSYAISRLLEHREENYAHKTVKSQIPASSDQGSSLAASALGPLLDKPAINFELVPKLDIFGDEDLSHESISNCFSHIMVNVKEEDVENEEEPPNSEQQEMLKKLANAKTAPPHSLTRRLATCLMSRIDKNLIGFCRLWMKFLDVLRHHWEYNLDLPGMIANEKPDLGHCLLHQKLQMVQYCIHVKKAKHSEFDSNERSDPSTSKTTEEDEFFDAEESFDENFEELPSTSNTKILESPQGRSHQLEPQEFLKNFPDRQIYVPITQEQGPMTEDQLDKHESFLLSLENTTMRNKFQSDLLLSDMQAFKAANPGCVLEDFLRWHSPRDLVEGQLSERMQLPGNLWQESWRLARPVPAAKQSRLFNETKEVEQIFQYFTNIKLKELIDLLLPVVAVQMAEILVENSSKCMDPLKAQLERLIGQIHYATKTMDNMEDFYNVAESLSSIEKFEMQFSSLTNLFAEQATKASLPLEIGPTVSTLVTSLCQAKFDTVDELSLKSPELNIQLPMDEENGGQLLEVIKSFMANDDDTQENEWAKPKRKQIILRRMVPHPGPGSREMPQRMYTSYREGEFLLCGAFTSDVTFL